MTHHAIAVSSQVSVDGKVEEARDCSIEFVIALVRQGKGGSGEAYVVTKNELL